MKYRREGDQKMWWKRNNGGSIIDRNVNDTSDDDNDYDFVHCNIICQSITDLISSYYPVRLSSCKGSTNGE